eukprot:g22004.t1
MSDALTKRLLGELEDLVLIDPHTHINPLAAASTTLADIMGYHYYTELAHSAGLEREAIEEPGIGPKEKVSRLIPKLADLENTVQVSWLLEMCREFFGFEDGMLTQDNWEALYDRAETAMAADDWEQQVLKQSKLEKVFLTNDFDDPLEGFDTSLYVPCLRTDDLVFHLAKPATRERLAKATGSEFSDAASLVAAIGTLFEHFTSRGARACAISLPPDFAPAKVDRSAVEPVLQKLLADHQLTADDAGILSRFVFWTLAEFCNEHALPFDLMIGVNRSVYRAGVYQGQDLFDSRVSLIQYGELFNAFPRVTFPISVLASVTNQELVSYSWIFPNVVTNGHWWYSNIPTYIEFDCRARLQAVPANKQIGYYSDMYKLEFALPKFAMYRRILADALARDFVVARGWSEEQAVALGRRVLRGNVEEIFKTRQRDDLPSKDTVMATLVLLQGGEATPYDLGNGETVIGRHPDCSVQLQSNMVSRRHARVRRDGTSYIIEDLGSGNGTVLNGKPVESPTPLQHKDRIKLGPVLLRFEADGAQPETSEPFGGPEGFRVDITTGADDAATIMGAIESSSGFGMLDVQPEAKLAGVLEISRSLAGSVELPSLLPKILDTLFNIFPKADRGCIMLKDEASGQMNAAAQKHRREGEDETVRLSRTILNRVLEEKTAVLSADAANDTRFEASESISNLTIRSMMCVPMIGLDGEPMGVINLDTQNPINQFKTDDLELLIAVANQAAMSYESARLLVSHIEKQKQDSELRIARGVQHALLPEKLPEVEGYEFYASYDSAQAVGGDYYDAGLLEGDKMFLAFGDVAGKGVPGALIMSRLSSVVQTTMAFTHDVTEAMTNINNHMCANAVEGRFVTFVLVVIDLKTHEMSLVNGGHMSPLIRSPDGNVEEFQADTIGLPIGIIEDYPYAVVSRVLKPGEIVVIVTDGVDEAMNPEGELYTKERVEEFVKNGSPRAEDLGKSLLADVRVHANGRAQNDDITIMTFGRNLQ